jgi:mono/diheme cytochrome c family protein
VSDQSEPAQSSGKSDQQSRRLRVARLIVWLVIAELVLLPFVVRLDGKTHADWQQFFGRFHPLAVHLPIGLLVLVPLLEIAGRIRPALREAAGFVLALAAAACVGSLALGYLLAYGSGESGSTLTLHMWGGITLSVLTLACALARPAWASGRLPFAYPALLIVALVALLFTAHEGGSLTHGSSYLTQYMPPALKSVFGPAIDADPNSFYAKTIHPIFDSNCVSCHGNSKVEGGLRLDSYARLMRGGRDGAVIVAGNPEHSILVQRITLPVNDKHFMPSEGKPPLKTDQIAAIEAWIRQGASPTATSIAGVSQPEAPIDPPPQPVDDYSALMPEIQTMDKAIGAKLVPVSSKPSDGLILETVDIAPAFNDAQLAQLAKFAPYIVEADLQRTAITDASFDTLAKFTHLRALHLESTAINGSGLGKIAGLAQLTYLNLSGTQVTRAAVGPLASMKNLHHLYLFNTPAQPAPAAQPAEPRPAS